MNNKHTLQEYMNAVDGKLHQAAPWLKKGVLQDRGNIRDDMGLMHTFSNIKDIAATMWTLNKGRDFVAEEISNFSGAGYSDVSQVSTIGAIDITIITLSTSIIPYLCIDRSMANPVDTIYYSRLVADGASEGLTDGVDVVPNLGAPNVGSTLGGAKTVTQAAATSGAISTAVDIIPGTIVVTAVQSGNTFTGTDSGSNGLINFSPIFVSNAPVAFVGSIYIGAAGVVNYRTAVITSAGMTSGTTLSVTFLTDQSSSTSGTGLTKVKPVWSPTQLVTRPKQIILEQNALAQANINKILANSASVGIGADYTNIHFTRISTLYTEIVNQDVINQFVALTDAAVSEIDLTNYNLSGTAQAFSLTKDDIVVRFIINMKSTFRKYNWIDPTVILTGTRGAAELESNNSGKWVPLTGIPGTQNGVCGTWDGMPVFRHSHIDSIDTNQYVHFYMAAKQPDNKAATLAFGEFLPLIQTPVVGNFANPLQTAISFYSQVGSKVILPTLFKKGRIKYTA